MNSVDFDLMQEATEREMRKMPKVVDPKQFIETTNPARVVFKKGTKRSNIAPRFDLLPMKELTRVARVLEHGEETHGHNNWKQGGDDFIQDLPNHALHHIMKYIEHKDNNSYGKDHPEDDLAHAVCNLLFLMYFDKEGE